MKNNKMKRCAFLVIALLINITGIVFANDNNFDVESFKAKAALNGMSIWNSHDELIKLLKRNNTCVNLKKIDKKMTACKKSYQEQGDVFKLEYGSITTSIQYLIGVGLNYNFDWSNFILQVDLLQKQMTTNDLKKYIYLIASRNKIDEDLLHYDERNINESFKEQMREGARQEICRNALTIAGMTGAGNALRAKYFVDLYIGFTENKKPAEFTTRYNDFYKNIFLGNAIKALEIIRSITDSEIAVVDNFAKSKFHAQMFKQGMGDYSGSIPWINMDNKKVYDNNISLKSKFTPSSYNTALNFCKNNQNNSRTGSVNTDEYMQLCANTAKLADVMTADDIRKLLYMLSQIELSDSDKIYKGKADTATYQKLIGFVGNYTQRKDDALISTIASREVKKVLHLLRPIYEGEFDNALKVIRNSVSDDEIRKTVNVSEG